MASDFQAKVDQASEAGEVFSKLYYDSFDKKRHLIQKLYLDSAALVWNGTPVNGLEKILKFFETLPTSEHSLDSLDCQPLIDQVCGGQMTIAIKTFGTVKYQGSKTKAFHQNFMLTSLNNVWKIVSESFRFQE
ncbi:NTF2-related export protein 2-like isoform X2 [Pecten maximus]|uniref:NTF2-related export protein 2-like isoform X2 n=1 Tax=Pecten maximus TaxID=6579 RepID=UPI0014587626|nr:NTF2-related export protein 2-like isoform X2 [Pecten maximus]